MGERKCATGGVTSTLKPAFAAAVPWVRLRSSSAAAMGDCSSAAGDGAAPSPEVATDVHSAAGTSPSRARRKVDLPDPTDPTTKSISRRRSSNSGNSSEKGTAADAVTDGETEVGVFADVDFDVEQCHCTRVPRGTNAHVIALLPPSSLPWSSAVSVCA